MNEVENLYIDCRRQGMNAGYDEFLAVYCAMRKAGYEIVGAEKIELLKMALLKKGDTQ